MKKEQKDTLTLALPQIAPIWLKKMPTLDKIIGQIDAAAKQSADLIAFGEAAVPGYPLWVEVTGGAAFNDDRQKEIHAHYQDQAVCIEDADLDEVCAALKKNRMACYLGIIENPRDRGSSRPDRQDPDGADRR